MKIRKNHLQVIAGVAGIGLCTSLYIILNHKHKDKEATLLLHELYKLLNPSAQGLAGEEAFDTQHAEEATTKVKGVLLLKPEQASRYAKTIHGAWGWLNDDEDTIYSTFRELKDKVQVSQVAQAYSTNYQISLIEELRNRMNSDEITQVLHIVNRLPRYRTLG